MKVNCFYLLEYGSRKQSSNQIHKITSDSAVQRTVSACGRVYQFAMLVKRWSRSAMAMKESCCIHLVRAENRDALLCMALTCTLHMAAVPNLHR